MPARQLVENMKISQPTVSRSISAMGDEIVRIGKGPSIQYALRDAGRGIGSQPVYRVTSEGCIRSLGTLVPVRPEGFVMQQDDGACLYSQGLPWWLFDMRPQGYLGRAYAARHAVSLGLPEQVHLWSDTHSLRALVAHGHDAVGNLLLGNAARDRFLASTVPAPIGEADKLETYVRLADEAARGELPGSSAGGEQPKFVAYAETPSGPRHVMVKFTFPDDNPVSERWRDLLLAEHLALDTLNAMGVKAVQTRILDFAGQRFLEVERFDRVGELGRHGLFSLAALDGEFVGSGTIVWPAITPRLVAEEVIKPEAADGAALLYAFGTLIGNTDMHTGNLSFMSAHGRPYDLAPAYDQLPMGFAPKSGGGMSNGLNPANLAATIRNEVWIHAEALAREYFQRIGDEAGFSDNFRLCIEALGRHIEDAGAKIKRLG